VYAFIEKKECSKEEKTCGQNWEIAQISYPVSMLVFVVHLFRARVYMSNDLKEKGECAGDRREMSPPWFSSKLDDDPAELVCVCF
jgi:hypothetical protein